MRSYNNLYEPMLQDDYIKQCFINASKKKKNRNDVREVLENLDEHTELLKKMLTEELFIPDYHKPSIINESSSKKTRRILKPHYKYEQVIHHCAIGQFKPIVMNGLYEFSCGSIPGRGVHYGKKYMRKWLDSYDGKKFFVLKMDVHHFFESINRRILKRKLKEVIRDKRFYRLLCILIEHDKIALVAKISVLDKDGKQVTKGRMLDFMGFQFHHDRTTIRKSNIEAARRKANHISKQDKISWYNASVMLSYMGLFKHTDTYNYYIDYIKPKINVKKLKRIVSKHSRKENEHDRLEKGDRNTAGQAGGGRQDIVAVNGLPA